MIKEISFGREVTSDLEAAIQREWLVTNGRGGYASATLAMANTRRYHGLLVAALRPPLERTLLVSKLEAAARIGVDFFPLTTNEYIDGTINPHGYLNLECFALEGMIPVFTWTVADGRLEQRIWMAYGHNTTYVTYTLVRASGPIALEVVPLCTYREARRRVDTRGWMPNVQSVSDGLQVNAGYESRPYWLRADRGTFVPGVVRHWSIRHRGDSYLGLADSEDLFAIGRLDTKLNEGETLALVLTTERDIPTDWQSALKAEKIRQAELLAQAGLEDEPAWVHRLCLAADQFVVERPDIVDPAPNLGVSRAPGKTINAGYPWGDDWSRNTLIALPGITLAVGRPNIAATVLRECADLLDQGTLPKRIFKSADRPPAYDAADVSLWFFHALYQYVVRTGDHLLLEQLCTFLVEILDSHLKGTPHGVGVDENDGLLRIGEAPAGLTWMNAHDGERVITPRVGKPVEINALWHNALGTMAHFCELLNRQAEADGWRERAAQVAASFQDRFWYEPGQHLYDVVDGPDGDDPRLRPNQILAVSLPFGPLQDQDKARAVVETVARTLHTTYGLRSLGPRDPFYAHRFGGSLSAQAAALHQGTVWAWLMGPFTAAHLKVYGDVEQARSFLRPFSDHLAHHGLGTISEIFDGDPPHTPRGCPASAWSVAQVLCGWQTCSAWEKERGED